MSNIRWVDLIASEAFHIFEPSKTTICCLTLSNGASVVGISPCGSIEHFNEALGREVARAAAFTQIGVLEEYAAKQREYELSLLAVL